MTVAGCLALCSHPGKDGPHPVSHMMGTTDLESEADHLYPYGVRSSIQNFPFMLYMLVLHCTLMQECLYFT